MVSYSLLSSFPALLGEICSRWVTPLCSLALSAFAAPTARGWRVPTPSPHPTDDAPGAASSPGARSPGCNSTQLS